MDRTTGQKISKEIKDLNNTINQLEQTGIYRTLHSTVVKYKFFSNAHGSLWDRAYVRLQNKCHIKGCSHIKQRSPTSCQWTSTCPCPVRNQAPQQEVSKGKQAELHLLLPIIPIACITIWTTSLPCPHSWKDSLPQNWSLAPKRSDAEAETAILWPPDVKNWLIGKDPDAGKDWRQEEKGTTENEVVGWHYRLNGHEFD